MSIFGGNRSVSRLVLQMTPSNPTIIYVILPGTHLHHIPGTAKLSGWSVFLAVFMDVMTTIFIAFSRGFYWDNKLSLSKIDLIFMNLCSFWNTTTLLDIIRYIYYANQHFWHYRNMHLRILSNKKYKVDPGK